MCWSQVHSPVFLFVLIGAEVSLNSIYDAGVNGLIIVGVGLLVGRWLGVFLATSHSVLTLRERFFMVVGDSAKATVQAAIGGIPLAMGVANGELILAIAVLSIIISAPLGAFGTVLLAPKLLEKGAVDPTKVNVKESFRFLVAFDDSLAGEKALQKAVRLARQLDAEIFIINVIDSQKDKALNYERLIKIGQELAADIPLHIESAKGSVNREILEYSTAIKADYIFIGKSNSHSFMGDVAREIVKETSTPVVLLASGDS